MPLKLSAGLRTLPVGIFVLAAIGIWGAGQVYAQVAGATLTGTVKDSSGGIIPDTQVAITDMATAVTRTVSSGGAGLISETFNAQFRAEVFNILNRANFSPPPFPNNTDIFDASGAANGSAGKLIATTTTAREIQFALKFTW